MKKLIMLLSFTIMALSFAAPAAHAQYHDTQACNTSLDGGFSNFQGLGPNGAFPIRFFIQSHYQMVNQQGVLDNFTGVATDEMNAVGAQKGYTVRFSPVDFRDTDPNTYNFTAYIDIYANSDGTYSTYLVLSGWGVGHLFRTSYLNAPDGGTALAGIVDQIPSFIQNGWSCDSNN